ncbi:alpha/gamma adaptin-binding protein p34 (macronuclear) [Tetrahymena thermophila SB210]|uniref:Alpha/gamma adaptin-binding protein p34 n=1 Tax=Tetrahymena thermophila (strain SB210) TaxID=312017 RepID=Q22XW2_TETTS|nr:alpha/gamma adaptin-binding protein p34 [Tetrahymena thermophila SB210]EAR90262.2 alpha/gamma adaptin-binding protein p34 [Tetrahymena thermophila SB210]|eukprot:XP_001010507.2 alpha/gamma adaptin-binding protein p34 [Tetrahymena thermophila SB210]
MQVLSQLQQSNTLILVNDYVDALRLIKCIIPYYEGKNIELKEEIKTKLQSDWTPEEKCLIKLENKMELHTKYYLAKTNIYILKYDIAIQDGEDEIIKDIQKKKLKFDSIFFYVTALASKQIYGHDKFCQIADKFNLTFQPQIQTLVYQKPDELEIDIDYIIKQEEGLESFTESVYEDFKKLSEQDQIVKPRAKSMLEETDGIARIIDILESNVWTDSEMFKVEKKQNLEQQHTKLNIHIPTYEKNKDIREKYEKYGNNNDDEEEEEINLEKQNNILKVNKNEEIEKQELKDKKQEVKEVNSNQEQKQQMEIDNKKQEEQQLSKENEQLNNNDTNKNINSNQIPEQKEDNKTKEQEENKSKDSKNKQNKQNIKYDNDDDEEIQENTLNDFVKILSQMKGLKDNSQQLPDEKRKENAEKFILNLMQTLGLDEESDDDN